MPPRPRAIPRSARSRSWLGAGGLCLRRRPRPHGRGGRGLRGAARGRRRAALRHPELPACRATSSSARSTGSPTSACASRPTSPSAACSPSSSSYSDMGYGAVFIGTGAGAPMFLGLKGETAGQVYSANEFLTRVNLMGGDRFPYRRHARRRRQQGGRARRRQHGHGLPAHLAARSAPRACTASTAAPRPRPRRAWKRVRHAKEEGIEFHFLRAPHEILQDEQGNITGMICQKMTLGEPDASGRRRPVPLEGEFEKIDCNTIIYAMGTQGESDHRPDHPRAEAQQVGEHRGGRRPQATSMPGVFAGGDIVTGGATVILALGAGRRAARAIAAHLDGGRKWPITKEDAAAFQPRAALAAGTAKAADLPAERRPRRTCAPSATSRSRATRSTSAAPARPCPGGAGTAARCPRASPSRTGCARRAAASSP